MLRSFLPFAALLASLGGCGLADSLVTGGSDSFQVGNVRYLKDWDGSFVLGSSTLRGTGTIVAKENVAENENATVGFRLEATLPEEAGSYVELIAFAKKKDRGLTSGTRVRVERDDNEVPLLKIFDSAGLIALTPFPLLDNHVNLQIDIQDGGAATLVWEGDADFYAANNAAFDTLRYHRRAPIVSGGLLWGIRLKNATLESATSRTAPHLLRAAP